VGRLVCSPVLWVVATIFVRFSSSNAPQNLQTVAVRGFLFLQTGQNFPELTKSISPQRLDFIFCGFLAKILHQIARNLNKEKGQKDDKFTANYKQTSKELNRPNYPLLSS
jgi:hypothetical protein